MEHTQKIKESLERLKASKEKLPELGQSIVSVGNQMYQMDFIIMGIVKRSLSITSGIEHLILDWNMTCARALLRMQLDTVLRLSAFWLSSDMHEMAEEVRAGKQINMMKDRYGERMTDSYLVRKLGEHFQWIPVLYKNTSAYIHFSERQIFDPVLGKDSEKRIIYWAINDKDYNFPEVSWLELTKYAGGCLEIIMHFLNDYKKMKELTS